MNILFLTQVLPFPMDAGPKTRSYLVLRHLAKAGHRVYLVSLIRDEDRPEYIEHLRPYCSAIHTVLMRRSKTQDILSLIKSLGNGAPFLIERDHVPAMANAVREVIQAAPSIDAVHADQLWMAPYAQLAAGCTKDTRAPLLVLDQHNAVFQIPSRLAETERNVFKRALLKLEARKLTRYETMVCSTFDRVAWVTEEDRLALFGGAYSAGKPGAHVVIPIAQDLSNRPQIHRDEYANRITFIGGLHWPPNARGVAWFLDKIWPRIKSKRPDSRVTIIGKSSLDNLKLNAYPGVEATGYVADPSRYLKETSVFIVPLLAGGGMRVKILDAWAWGLPIVSTKIGAEGLYARHSENMLLADDPEAFAAGVLDIMQDPSLAGRLVSGGRKTLEAQYDWNKIYAAWDSIYPRNPGAPV